MNARLIFYISGLLIYGVFRSFYATSDFDKIGLHSDEAFVLNGKSYPTEELDEVIRAFRKTIPPDQKDSTVIELSISRDIKMGVFYDVKNALRKNGFGLIIFRDKPYWHFWK